MNSKKGGRLLFTLLGLLVLGLFIAYKITYKPHDAIEDLPATLSGTSEELIQRITEEPDQWKDAIVETTGNISDRDDMGVMLNGKIYCQFRETTTSNQFSVGEPISIKGRYIGYDDLLEEIKLDQCILIN